MLAMTSSRPRIILSHSNDHSIPEGILLCELARADRFLEHIFIADSDGEIHMHEPGAFATSNFAWAQAVRHAALCRFSIASPSVPFCC